MGNCGRFSANQKLKKEKAKKKQRRHMFSRGRWMCRKSNIEKKSLKAKTTFVFKMADGCA
jgi:hypothetical protein